MLLKVDCLPNAVGKQPSIPLIDLGRKWMIKQMMMMMINLLLEFVQIYIVTRNMPGATLCFLCKRGLL